MSEALTGGCQCGAVRFSTTHAGRDAYWCHCRMCQRALGNVAAAFWNVTKDSVAWKGERAAYMSSPFGRRGFCGICGTPLTFDYPDSPKIDLTVGALDDPGAVSLTSHFGIESRVHGWTAGEELPEMRTDDYAPLQQRWAKVQDAT
ncbi:GFA family protein [Sphingopyxis sp. OPL5]|uniref:GFA family protein n=1 Tax=Sphingopyxis sp. OPL5 TaxID=2486273 RepID=UPI00164CF50E|nr:GFA family protein [Sphingopyxis sp. OPL5]QNO28893.1 GFA family protein [Sphingopyxis sp. OPL5]